MLISAPGPFVVLRDEVSFCHNLVFPSHGEFEELVSEKWKHPEKCFHTSKMIDFLFPGPDFTVVSYPTR